MELYFQGVPPTKLLLIAVGAIATRFVPLILKLLKKIKLLFKDFKVRIQENATK